MKNTKQKTADLPFDNSDMTESKMNLLIERYRHLVSITINKKYNAENFRNLHGIEFDELEQFGLIGLSKAIEQFEQGKNKNFQTFAISHIAYSISNMTKKYSINSTGYSYDLQNKVSLDLPVDNIYGQKVRDEVDNKISKTGYSYEDLENKILVEEMLKKLPPHVGEIIQMRLGGMTLQEIANVRGVTHQSIRQTLVYHEPRIKYYLGMTMKGA